MSFQAYKVSGNPCRKRTVPFGFELRRTMRLSVISWSISKKSIASSFTGCDMMLSFRRVTTRLKSRRRSTSCCLSTEAGAVESKLSLRPRDSRETRVEVHGFLAGDLQRVVNTHAGRSRHILPPGQKRQHPPTPP